MRRFWSAQECDILRQLYPCRPTAEVAETLQRSILSTYNTAAKLGLKKSQEFLASDESGRLRKGQSRPGSERTQFKKGQVPFNKGLKLPGWAPGRMRETQFKKGELFERLEQVIPQIREGSKQHTIRAKRKLRPHVGEVCHVYVNPRQKSMRLLGRWKCTRVEDIRIDALLSFGPAFGRRRICIPMDLRIWIDGELLSKDETNSLCWQDGFRDGPRKDAWSRFVEHWEQDSRNQVIHGRLYFEGDLIHWDFSKPVELPLKRARRKAA